MVKIKRKSSDDRLKDVSVANLIDVLFVLLAIFLISASYVSRPKVPVNLPQAKHSNLMKDSPVEILISKKGEVYIKGKFFKLKDLREKFKNIPYKDNIVFVKADEEAPYGKVIDVMEALSSLDIKNISLITQKTD